MRSLYESILDGEEDLIQGLDNVLIKKYYLKEILRVDDKEDEEYGPLVTFENKNTQLKNWGHISASVPFITFVDKFYTDKLNIYSNDVYESNFKNKQIEFNGWMTGDYPRLNFAMPNAYTLENVDIKSNTGLSGITFGRNCKSIKNCKFEMGCDDAYVDCFYINIGLSKINDWKAFKELTIINKTLNNKYNRLTIKAWDTALSNKFFKKVKKFKPNTQSKADYEEIQRTAMDYFYKEIEPNINHIPGLSVIHMFVDGGWNVNYNTVHKKWRGFVKDLETGEWTYVDKFNAYKENIFKF